MSTGEKERIRCRSAAHGAAVQAALVEDAEAR